MASKQLPNSLQAPDGSYYITLTDGSGNLVTAGTGTVSTVSVATANGVSGTVATATTTPAITITLGAITPSSVTVPGAAAAVLNTTTTVTSGAGSSAGTLTNAPAIGNPTKWIPFNDAGVTRYFPAW